MRFFDLHCDTAYLCYDKSLNFYDDNLAVTPQKTTAFDEWHQCFAIFIKDGLENPFEYYKKVLDNFKIELKRHSPLSG